MSLTLYPCERCQDYFSSEYALAHHHRYNHGSEPDLRCSDGIELESHAALTETSSHEPNLCRESQMEIDCFDQASVIEGSRTKYVCKVCHEVFITKSLLTSHQKLVHLELLVHVCAVCHEVFPNRKALVKHKKLTHPELLVYECVVCHEKFPERHALINHKKHCDSGNNYECNVCHEAFPLRRLLTNHQKLSHPELLAHKCDLCDKKFLKEENLIKHKNDFHDEQNERKDGSRVQSRKEVTQKSFMTKH